jgi:hypothetical protein
MKKPRFNPFPPVSGRYGAPMGRCGTNPANLQDEPASALCVSNPQGEYDSGGAYWGFGWGEGPVYAVWARGRGHELGVAYVRAHSKAEAINKIKGE